MICSKLDLLLSLDCGNCGEYKGGWSIGVYTRVATPSYASQSLLSAYPSHSMHLAYAESLARTFNCTHSRMANLRNSIVNIARPFPSSSRCLFNHHSNFR